MPGGLLVIVHSVGTPPDGGSAGLEGEVSEIGTYPTARSTAVAFITALLLSIAAPALADSPPLTNGGNGAGQSGQYTGNPDDRPASCGSK
jgi:hypothetical protein